MIRVGTDGKLAHPSPSSSWVRDGSWHSGVEGLMCSLTDRPTDEGNPWTKAVDFNDVLIDRRWSADNVPDAGGGGAPRKPHAAGQRSDTGAGGDSMHLGAIPAVRVLIDASFQHSLLHIRVLICLDFSGRAPASGSP